ncbi:MAG: hypothetical protein WC241_01165 [Candidatus Paceibacterota bacterium]|jgi:chromosome segregation ATPase
MEKEIKGLIKTVDIMAKNVAKVLDRMDKIENTVLATRDELKDLNTEVVKFKLKTSINLTDIQTDIKSFKQETRDNFKEVNIKLDDLSDTDMNYDKRIEKLEDKVFA